MTTLPASTAFSLSRALIITRREVRDQLRDWRIITPILTLTVFFPLLMNFTANQAVAFVQRFGAELIADRLIPFLLMVVGFFPISVSLVIALESFVGEKERYSLEPLLSSPMTDTELYVGKMLAAMLPPLFAAYLGIGVYLTGLALTIEWYAEPVLLIQILSLTTVQALVMVAAAVVISAQVTSVRAANLLASFVVIPFALLIQGESMIMFWGQYDVLWWALFGLSLVAVVLVRMGVQLFNREELLGRDIDEINFRAAWRTFATAFIGQARGAGAGRWYRREVLPAARRLAQPALGMLLALAVAIVIGYQQASVFRLPAEQVGQVREVAADFSSVVAEFGFMSARGALSIFLINLRALAIATLLGVFSWGTLAVVLLMLPLGLTGYFAGQLAFVGVSPLTFYAAFILPHGVLEIPAAVLAGAAIMRLGASIISPPPGKTLGQAWLEALADWAKVAVGLVIPLLIGAAVLESFVTPLAVEWLLGW